LSKVSEVRDKTSLYQWFLKKRCNMLETRLRLHELHKVSKVPDNIFDKFFFQGAKCLKQQVSRFHKFHKVSKVPNQILTSCFVEVQNASNFISL